MSTILIHHDQQVAYLTFNRPEKFNSFNRDMALAFQTALDDAAANSDVRCMVISGAGKAFCAGQDLAEATDPNGPALSAIVSEHYNPIIHRLRAIEKPIIAAVNGVAAGAGANIALACDIVVATESASFIQAFSKIGLIPDSGGTFMLPRLIGQQRAGALMLTGDKVSATEAVAMGMIYRSISDSVFVTEYQALAVRLAQMPTIGLGLTKRLLNQSFEHTLSDQLESEKELQVVAGKTDDFKEGVAAFLEKRAPSFKGS